MRAVRFCRLAGVDFLTAIPFKLELLSLGLSRFQLFPSVGGILLFVCKRDFVSFREKNRRVAVGSNAEKIKFAPETLNFNTMKKSLHCLLALFFAATAAMTAQPAASSYTPTPENLAARKAFSDDRFGIFLHWGIYSLFGQGEWYLHNANLDYKEYAKAAGAFYPAAFDADAWVKAIKDAGAGYVCFTTRHHDSFSMFQTRQSDYNIVDATPFGRDVLKELADACQRHGIRLHLYYSHLDWARPEYPLGRTGRGTHRPKGQTDWPAYYAFMNAQLTELLTNYGPIGAIWFDGVWDHDEDATPFDWQLDEQYALIHRLQPACLIGNNHHSEPYPGEDIQIFERDLPGENKAGLSGQAISRLPLETCQTMNGMWGYKIADQNYKSVEELVAYIVRAAGKGANLLLNIGPQPDGRLPQAALDRLKRIGEWMRTYGATIRCTQAGDVRDDTWGATTRRGDTLFVHVLNADRKALLLPLDVKVKRAVEYVSRKPVSFERCKAGIVLDLTGVKPEPDYVIELITK